MSKSDRSPGGEYQSREIVRFVEQIKRERARALNELAHPATRRIGEARMVMVGATEDLVELLNAYARGTDD